MIDMYMKDDVPWRKELNENQRLWIDGGLKHLLSDVNDVGWFLLRVTLSRCKGGKGNSKCC